MDITHSVLNVEPKACNFARSMFAKVNITKSKTYKYMEMSMIKLLR